MKENEVEKLLEEWQERLGLQDWNIILRYNCKKEDMELEDVNGESSWTTSRKVGVIRILNLKLCEDDIEEFDFEEILVHELLHLKFSLLEYGKDNYANKVALEVRHQLIDDLARALVMAKNGETKRKLAKDCKKVKELN